MNGLEGWGTRIFPSILRLAQDERENLSCLSIQGNYLSSYPKDLRSSILPKLATTGTRVNVSDMLARNATGLFGEATKAHPLWCALFLQNAIEAMCRVAPTPLRLHYFRFRKRL